MKNILVTGGAGYIGSHVCKLLATHGYNPITYDNLSRGNEWSVKWGPLVYGDLLHKNHLRNTLLNEKIITVTNNASFFISLILSAKVITNKTNNLTLNFNAIIRCCMYVSLTDLGCSLKIFDIVLLNEILKVKFSIYTYNNQGY